jgi:L-fuconolactonase
MFTEEMPWLKGHDLDWVMGRGIGDWIGWRT